MDAVYKPIMRKFRSYFRDRFDQSHNKKGYMHWKTEKYISEIQKFMATDLNLPKELMEYQNVAKMLTLLFPQSTRRPIPNLRHEVDRILLAQVFREQNRRMRKKFFSDPFVKYLWSKIFITKSPEIFVSYLRQLRGPDNDGEAKCSRFLGDVMQMELSLNCKVIPDIARDQSPTTTFSAEKQEKMVANTNFFTVQAIPVFPIMTENAPAKQSGAFDSITFP